TRFSLLGEFMLAILRNTEVQAKAHSKHERVFGPGNLPSVNDAGLLPYITAVVRETLRYSLVSPLGE
ncbi:hypothetical protein F5879DRAFT_791753, partial [Lentinula edodes]